MLSFLRTEGNMTANKSTQGNQENASEPRHKIKIRHLNFILFLKITRQVYNLFQDLWKKLLGFFIKIKKGAKNGARIYFLKV